MTDQETATIYPEAIRRHDIKQPGPWRVKSAPGGAVELEKKRAWIPTHVHTCETCGVDHAAAVRQHEMAHVAFSPANGPRRAKRAKLHPSIINGVEDMRISQRMATAGKPIPATCCADYLKANLDHVVVMQDWPEYLCLIAASRTDEQSEQAFIRWFEYQPPGPAKDMAAASWEILHRGIKTARTPTFAHTLKTARQLQDLLPGQRQPGGKSPDVTAKSAGWMKMDIETPDRPRPARNTPQQRWTNRDEGTNPRAMHHYATDGRIFGQKAKKPTPVTVLIDGSGSMSWDAADLRALLDAAPASTVAIYDCDDRTGTLRILAEHGKRVEDSMVVPPHGGSGNGVDGPALRWLAKHPGRKIWVSDGGVHGDNSISTTTLHRECREIITGNSIMRVRDAAAAVAVTRGKQRFQPSNRDTATGRGY